MISFGSSLDVQGTAGKFRDNGTQLEYLEYHAAQVFELHGGT
ncbi:MAG TPA: hypothetical protein VI386_37245 [Candidatus Sulfotelmatobacter sp.]